MLVRNIWSLQPGECITAEEIMKKTKCEVFFPLRDIGVDLLIVKGKRHVGVQVKKSRHKGHSWHQIRKNRFLRNKDKVDFYVFLTYYPFVGEHKISSFQNKFLVVPTIELERRMRVKDPGKSEKYSFCFHFEDGGVWDERVTVELNNKLTNYSEFLDAWHLIKWELEKAK